MTDLVTSAQMRAIERSAIESGVVTGLALMERAGEGVVAAILARWPGLAGAPAQALVLCGPGNNGGDGYVIARLLAARGWRLWVFSLGDPARLPPDARTMAQEWERAGQAQAWSRDTLENAALHLDPDIPLVVVDALFGIGLSRPLGREVTAPWSGFVDLASNLSSVGDLYLVAVDVPSGVSEAMPDGQTLWGEFAVDTPRLTVTFHALKAAHRAMIAEGEAIVVADIGLGS